MTVTVSNLYLAGFAISVQAVQGCACHSGDVDWHIQGTDDAGVTIGKAVLDVIQGCVDQHASVIPGC